MMPTAVNCLLAIILLAVLLVAGWDVAAAVSTWQARIGIGRWESRESWQAAIRKRAGKWLERTPAVPRTDNTRYILPDILRGAYKSSAIQDWQTAGLLMGLGKEEAESYAEKHPDAFKEVTETDTALLAYALKEKGALTPSQEDSIRTRFLPYADAGTIPYRTRRPDVRFVDTVGLVCPFLYATGLEELADRQIGEFDKVLLDGVFPPHAYRTDTSLPLGVYDWSRGTGWYILGLTESGRNEARILKLAEKMLELQRQDGSFGCFLFDSASPSESSGTALAGLLFIQAYRISSDKRYLQAAKGAEKALMRMTRRDGTLDCAQGDTLGIGSYSRRFDRMPFAQGMALRLSRSLDGIALAERNA